jgi:uncharacterized membrane-anchored protein
VDNEYFVIQKFNNYVSMLKKLTLVFLTAFFLIGRLSAQAIDSTELKIQAIEQSLTYQSGTINLGSGHAKITVPDGFQFLDKEQSKYVLTDLWGNPPDESVLGMLVPATGGVLGDKSWAFIVSYEEIGFVDDEDAEDFDYDELLEQMKKETSEANPDRIKDGYEAIQLIGWASVPHYDKENKTLHWAKEFKFGNSTFNTLNYDIRFLGRKGVITLNAVATMDELGIVKSNISKITQSIEFDNGFHFSDFDPDVDEVAGWTVGGLVAGKILAKVGFFGLLLKFWKLIFVAVASAGGVIWRFITGRNQTKS